MPMKYNHHKIHIGDSTHHHDHSITPVSLSATNRIVSANSPPMSYQLSAVPKSTRLVALELFGNFKIHVDTKTNGTIKYAY